MPPIRRASQMRTGQPGSRGSRPNLRPPSAECIRDPGWHQECKGDRTGCGRVERDWQARLFLGFGAGVSIAVAVIVLKPSQARWMAPS